MTRQESRPFVKSATHQKKAAAERTPRPEFEVTAKVLGRVFPISRIYKGCEIKVLAKVQCEVMLPANSDTYTVVFVREKSASAAMKLQIGDTIALKNAYLQVPPKGHGSTEIHAKRFEVLR